MDRKINLAKIGKNAQIARAFASPTKNEAGQTSTASPFFSPVANRTRGNRKDKNHDEKAGVRQLHTDKVKLDGISEPMKAIQKKLAAGSKKATERKHIKIESDESEKPTTSREVKKEIKEEPDQDEKVVKKGAKRKSNDKKAAGIKTEPDVNDKENGGDDGGGGVSEEKQTKWEPNNWRQLLANIREMRKERNAPVDTMGCDKCYDEHTDEKTKRFHHLVALMLSSQTKDAVTYDAMSRLKRHGLTPQKMIETSTDDLQQLLYPVGFYKTKAKHIQQTSQILIDKFDSDIPNDIKGLISLPGVGMKMAHICMRVAWNIVTGIGVDTHVHRIANRLKWVQKETKEPEKTRVALEKWLPFEDWPEVNELLVGFGQTICKPVNPRCDECLNAMICPASSVKGKKTSNKNKSKE